VCRPTITANVPHWLCGEIKDSNYLPSVICASVGTDGVSEVIIEKGLANAKPFVHKKTN